MKLFLLLLALVFTLPSHAEKPTPEQYWSRTGLTTKAVTQELQILESKSCLAGERTYLGCLAAINAVAGMAEPALIFVPKKLVKQASAGVGEEVFSFGEFSLAKKLPDEASDQDTLRSNFLRQDSKRKILRKENLASIQAAPRFSEVFTKVVELSKIDAQKDALAAAAAVSAFFSEAVDSHARIESYEQLQDSLNDADKSFTGIGANLQEFSGKIIIQSPIEGSPAMRAGLKSNDILLAVNHVPVGKKKITDVVKEIRGPEGSQVVIRVARKGTEMDFQIVRQKISLPNVEAKVVQDFGISVGVIRLRSFMDNEACMQVAEKIEWLKTQKVSALVMDLRGNGGGLVNEAVCMGGLFVGEKVIVQVKNLESNEMRGHRSWATQLTQLPMVTLIDSGSASASEILSGALQDYQRSWIVGERSFGKGTVQAPRAFYNDKIVLFRTIQRFYQPSGRTNQMVGITPDFEVFEKLGASDEDRFRLREADIYPFGLEAVGPVWKQPRVKEVTKIQSCLSSKGLAAKKAQQLEQEEKLVDLQLLTAQEVFLCSKP